MLSILVANSKGGCGKTTVATNLAAAFAAGGLATALADADRQKSSLDWVKRRSDALPSIAPLDWTKEIDSAPKGTMRLIIDAPAALKRTQVKDLLAMADVVVLPLQPSAFDEAATRRFLKTLDDLKPIRKNRKPVAGVGNRVRLRTRAATRLDSFLETLGHAVVARVRESAVYSEAAFRGQGLFDLSGKRAEGLREDWLPLLRYIESQD
ncbi:MAG: chromosome partitioning protein ParA [Rhodospirillaceae bacterium]|nr:chromosome partitioning protein ParA [Rhodospirillaceae bacterium]|tara:strand:+ start:142 stop:768 length:627 start_codon:yes stop_codon:yes gene_type:complete